MTAGSVPLVFGSEVQFLALRSVLARLHYDEASICARRGIPSIFDFHTSPEHRQTASELKSGLDALIHLLMDAESISVDHLRSLVPADSLAVLESLGVLSRVPDRPDLVYGAVLLYPVRSLYVASDRGVAIDSSDMTREREVVYPAITLNTRRFLDSLPRTPCEELLDLCSGSGIAALIGAAGYATHAWSCDLAERSVEFAEFNRRLNGIGNMTCLQGDLYDAVAGRTFDRIVAHPPYVPSDEQEVLFRDGGADGEQVLRGVIAGLPRHLRVGGLCCCQSMATDREAESLEQRIRGWLGPEHREFDLILVANYVQSRNEYLRQLRLNPKAADMEPLLSALKVTSLFYGAVVLHRFAESRAPVTMRTRKATEAGPESIEWLVHWMTTSAAPDFDDLLRQARPRLSPHLVLNVAHVVENGALVPHTFELSSTFPFAVGLSGGWLAVLVDACDGKTTSAGLLAELQRRQVIPADLPEAQFLRDLRALISCGFLEIDSFPLPRKPA